MAAIVEPPIPLVPPPADDVVERVSPSPEKATPHPLASSIPTSQRRLNRPRMTVTIPAWRPLRQRPPRGVSSWWWLGSSCTLNRKCVGGLQQR